MKTYTFTGPGGTTGKSGRPYRWSAGQTITAPADEFDHLGEGAFTDAPAPRGAQYENRLATAVPPGAVEAPLPAGADPAVDVAVSATPGTPPDPAASQASFPADQGHAATMTEGKAAAGTATDGSKLGPGTGKPNVTIEKKGRKPRT